jgi:peptidoglycan hydrolase-like protein with peptidoglycan-binding domain
MMNFRELMNTLDNINKPILSEALTLSAIIALTSGYEQDDKVRIPKLADLAKQNGLEGLVDPVTGHYVNNEGDEEDEVPFEIGQKLAQAGLLPKNARLEQAGWFDNQDVWNKANAGLVDQSSTIAGQATDTADKIKKLQELFAKYVELYNKKHAAKTGAAPVAGATPPGIMPQAAQGIMNQAASMMPNGQAMLNNIPGLKESQGLSNALIESFGYDVITEAGAGELAAKAVGKRIPGVGLAISAKDAYDRAQKGDWTGAGLAGLAGLASTIPGIGTAASIGLDALNSYTDPDDEPASGSNPTVELQKVIGATPDGKFGPKSAEALKVWQQKNGLQPTGHPDHATYAKAGINMAEQTLAESIAALRKKLEAIENQPQLDEGAKWDAIKGVGSKALAGAKNFIGGMTTGTNPTPGRANTSTNPNVNLGRPGSTAGDYGAWTNKNRGKVAGLAGAAIGAGAMDYAKDYDAAQTQGQSPVGKQHSGGGHHGGHGGGGHHGGHGGGGYDPAVAALQQQLKAQGADLGTTGPNGDGIDGIMGPLTQAAQAKFGAGAQPTAQAPAAADAAGDKELADMKAQLTALIGDISKSGSPEAQKAATDMQAKLSTMQ